MARSRNVGLSRPRTRSNIKDSIIPTSLSNNNPSNAGAKNVMITPTKPSKRPSNEVHSIQISSSPIKRIKPSPSHANQFSSPLRMKKSVAFSDDLISDLPSSPDKQTPRKSILKTCNQDHELKQIDPNNVHLWETTIDGKPESYGPSNGNFWVQGTVVQLPSNSPKLPELIAGCIKNLTCDTFTKRFEVYATLNNIFKTNTIDQLKKLFVNSSVSEDTHYIIELSSIIKTDITNLEAELFETETDKENITSPSKSDPFRIRVLVQALKLISNILLEQELNNFMPIEDAKWYYLHASSMLLKPTISKALISPYLIIMKDCRFSNKRKRTILESEIPETMLTSLINMKSSPSSSIITERFLCFRNFVISFPNIMAKNINHWLDVFIMNVCSLPMPFFIKCIGVGTNSLLEVAKVYLSNTLVSSAIDQFLASHISLETKSLVFDSSLEINSPSKLSGLDYMLSKLETLIYDGHYKPAMDIWVALTIMLGGKINNTPFEKWNNITRWVRLNKICFDSKDVSAMMLSLNSWKAIIYNLSFKDFENLKNIVEPIMRSSISMEEKQQAITHSLKPKVKLLTHLFTSLNSYAASKEVIDSLHNLFISILYLFINPLVIRQATAKYLYIYWDKLIQPIMLNFYFKKGESTPYMHELGFMVLTRLMRPSMPTTEKNFSEVRCLSNEPVSISEINSLPPRWIHSKFDKVLHSLVLVFQSKLLSVEKKFNFLHSFLASIRLITKKEVKPSKVTLDIIDSIPFVFTQLLEDDENVSFDWTHKTLLHLHDTFQPNVLATQKREISTKTIYGEVSALIPKFTDNQARVLLTLITSSLSENEDLRIVLDLCRKQELMNNKAIELFLQDFFSNRAVSMKSGEIELCGEICEYLPVGFETFIKKVVQVVVALSNSEDLKTALSHLGLSKWKMENYKFFLRLMQNAPNSCIQSFVLESIRFRFEDSNSFVDLFKFLVEDKFHSQLINLHDEIIQMGTNLEGFLLFSYRDALIKYLSDISINPTSFKKLDTILATSHEVLQINIEVFIKEKIEHLPQVRKCLGLVEEHPAEKVDQQMEAVIDTEETLVDEAKDNKVTENSNVGDLTEVPSESALQLVDITQLEESSASEVAESEVMVTSTYTDSNDDNTNNAPKVAEEDSEVMSQRTPSNFDIHSFTAMLNSRLSNPAPSSKRGKKRKRSTKKYTALETEPTKSIIEVQVASSLEINDEVCESENDTFSQSTFNESDIIDDDSISCEVQLKQTLTSTQINTESVEIVPPIKESEELQAPIKEAEKEQEEEIVQNHIIQEDLEQHTDATESSYSSGKDSQLLTFQSQNFKAHSTAVDGNGLNTSELQRTSAESESISSNDSLLSFRSHSPCGVEQAPLEVIQESAESIQTNERLESTVANKKEDMEVNKQTKDAILAETTADAPPKDVVVTSGEASSQSSQQDEEVNSDAIIASKTSDFASSLDSLMNIDDSELKKLTAKARFDVETKLLQFMLRIRNVSNDQDH